MKNIEILKSFYREVNKNKTLIFNYSKVSEFERDLFISISNYINRKYKYQLKGLTKLHYYNLKKTIDIASDDNKLIRCAFKLQSMISKRTTTMGYGRNAEKKIIKNYKLNIFIETLGEYIEEYDKITRI